MAAAATLGAACCLRGPATAILPFLLQYLEHTADQRCVWPVAYRRVGPVRRGPHCPGLPPFPSIPAISCRLHPRWPNACLLMPAPDPPPLSLPPPRPPAPALRLPCLPAAMSLDCPGLGVTTAPRTTPSSSVRGVAKEGPPAYRPPRPAPPATLALRTLSPPAAAAWQLPLTTSWNSIRACGTLLCSTWHRVAHCAAIFLPCVCPARRFRCVLARAPILFIWPWVHGLPSPRAPSPPLPVHAVRHPCLAPFFFSLPH